MKKPILTPQMIKCPCGAETIKKVTSDFLHDGVDTKGENDMDAMKCMLERRSVRAYKADKVPEDVIDQILEAGLYAPTGMGKQESVSVYVEEPEMVAKLSKMNAEVMGVEIDPFYGAKQLIIVFYNGENYTHMEDGALILGNMMNAAYALGVDSCWIHRALQVFESEEGKKMKEAWGVPANYVGIGHVILGYHDGEFPQAPPRKPGRVVKVK